MSCLEARSSIRRWGKLFFSHCIASPKILIFQCPALFFTETPQIRDIRPDEELLLGERQPIQLDGGEEAADKAEEEEEEEEEERKQQVRENSLEEDDVLDEEDNTVKCLVCDKAFPDVYM